MQRKKDNKKDDKKVSPEAAQLPSHPKLKVNTLFSDNDTSVKRVQDKYIERQSRTVFAYLLGDMSLYLGEAQVDHFLFGSNPTKQEIENSRKEHAPLLNEVINHGIPRECFVSDNHYFTNFKEAFEAAREIYPQHALTIFKLELPPSELKNDIIKITDDNVISMLEVGQNITIDNFDDASMYEYIHHETPKPNK